MGNRLEQDIIELFNRDIALHASIHRISKFLKKTYPYINTKVNELIDEKILNKTEVGRSYLCSINLMSEKALTLLSLNEIFKKEKVLRKVKNSSKLIKELYQIKTNFKVYTIFLSKNSLIFVLDYIHDKEAIKNQFKVVKDFDLIFFTKEAFQSNVLDDKTLLRNHTILYSPYSYFELLQEIQDRLNMKYSGLFK